MKRRKENKKKLICPCCGEQRYKSELYKTLGREIWIWGVTRELRLSDLKHGEYQWACDSCLNSRKAILGNPRKQMYCDFDPNLAYFDQYRSCETCGNGYIFSKTEQLYWYENLRFWVQSKPKNCIECRKIIRQDKALNKELSEILLDKENISIKQMGRLSEIYDEINKPEKSKFYLALIEKYKRKSTTNKT